MCGKSPSGEFTVGSVAGSEVKVWKFTWKSRGFSVWQRVLSKREVIFSGKQCTKVVEAVHSAWDIQRLWYNSDISHIDSDIIQR